MLNIDAHAVAHHLDFPALIAVLEKGFAADFTMPQRQLFALSQDSACRDGFALLPSWNDEFIACKAFTYFPDNGQQNLPTLFSKIMLFSRRTGEPLAVIDGTSVTYWRTAAVSALAAKYLARDDAQHLLLLGTGHLALPLARAHLASRAFDRVSIWGRDTNKAANIVRQLQQEFESLHHTRFEVVSPDALTLVSSQADIIVSATGSATPLVLGAHVRPGCHVDLLGNHSRDQRECDSELVLKSEVFVDSRTNVLNEAGELLIPISEGRFEAQQIRAELAELCRNGTSARRSAQEITLFKSVGTALSDLLCAQLVFERDRQSKSSSS